MAIDDNADYTLTGAQVKDLAQRIQSGGGTSYTAGSGIDITNNEISVDNTEVPFLTDLAAVATSGSYTDLSNTPTIPAAQVNSDWNASSGISQILNRPAVRHVTSVSDAGWSGAENSLIDGSALAYWNGAYSGTSSNLKYFANSSVTTNNIQDSAVTTGKINGSAVTKAKMHGLPCPDYGNTITNWGTISSTTTKTTSADGYVVGKAIISGADKQAYVDIGGLQVAGIPYCTTNVSNLQVAFCIPVKSGTSVKFTCSSGGQFQGCRLLGWQM